MAILNWKIEYPDQASDAGAEQTRIGRLACSDSLATITTAGYLNQIASVPANQGFSPVQTLGYYPLPQDFWFIYFSGGSGMFSVSIDGNGVVTLTQAVGNSNLATVTMTAAEFNGMYAAPKLLVAPPGANKMHLVNNMQLVMTYGSANYAAGGIVAAQYDSTVHGGGVLATNSEAAADFFAAASTVFKFNGGLLLAPFSTCGNKGLYLSNATQAFTTGDSTFVALVKYSTISLT